MSLSFWAKQGGKGRRIGYSREWGQASIRHNNRQQQQPRLNAPARAKTLERRILLRWRSEYA